MLFLLWSVVVLGSPPPIRLGPQRAGKRSGPLDIVRDAPHVSVSDHHHRYHHHHHHHHYGHDSRVVVDVVVRSPLEDPGPGLLRHHALGPDQDHLGGSCDVWVFSIDY